MKLLCSLVVGIGLVSPGFGQSYASSNVTGQLLLTGTVNLSQLAATSLSQLQVLGAQSALVSEKPPNIPHALWRPTLRFRVQGTATSLTAPVPPMTSLGITPSSSAFHFNGITQVQQRASNNGNQFSIEPPSPSVAVGNNLVLEGVNNAVQVYDLSGNPKLPAVVSTNQLFQLSPEVIRGTPDIDGAFPTDMRVFYDQGINRWFVLQRAQDNDAQGNPEATSHIYLAVSQTSDPTATYNIYTMDTTDPNNFFGCPCVADYPQIGADQYGFYISANEFNSGFFVDATILAISKNALAAGSTSPTAVRFLIPTSSGFEFAIQPAYTPPGASYFAGNGGLEYFVSTQGIFSSDTQVSVWAMSNTSSLLAMPNLQLAQIFTPVLPYSLPPSATQRTGPIPYGASLTPPRLISSLDGNDLRTLSVVYAGGRLYVTFATAVSDENNNFLVGGAYVILSPTFRAGILSANVLRQGYLLVSGNDLLRPAIAVNAQGVGAIAFTLAGPSYYPSAAFVPINATTTGSAIQVATFGAGPEDGFSGYDPSAGGIARWGDYSSATVAPDGSIWMGVEYIPTVITTTPPALANWGTLVMHFVP